MIIVLTLTFIFGVIIGLAISLAIYENIHK